MKTSYLNKFLDLNNFFGLNKSLIVPILMKSIEMKFNSSFGNVTGKSKKKFFGSYSPYSSFWYLAFLELLCVLVQTTWVNVIIFY